MPHGRGWARGIGASVELVDAFAAQARRAAENRLRLVVSLHSAMAHQRPETLLVWLLDGETLMGRCRTFRCIDQAGVEQRLGAALAGPPGRPGAPDSGSNASTSPHPPRCLPVGAPRKPGSASGSGLYYDIVLRWSSPAAPRRPGPDQRVRPEPARRVLKNIGPATPAVTGSTRPNSARCRSWWRASATAATAARWRCDTGRSGSRNSCTCSRTPRWCCGRTARRSAAGVAGQRGNPNRARLPGEFSAADRTSWKQGDPAHGAHSSRPGAFRVAGRATAGFADAFANDWSYGEAHHDLDTILRRRRHPPGRWTSAPRRPGAPSPGSPGPCRRHPGSLRRRCCARPAPSAAADGRPGLRQVVGHQAGGDGVAARGTIALASPPAAPSWTRSTVTTPWAYPNHNAWAANRAPTTSPPSGTVGPLGRHCCRRRRRPSSPAPCSSTRSTRVTSICRAICWTCWSTGSSRSRKPRRTGTTTWTCGNGIVMPSIGSTRGRGANNFPFIVLTSNGEARLPRRLPASLHPAPCRCRTRSRCGGWWRRTSRPMWRPRFGHSLIVTFVDRLRVVSGRGPVAQRRARPDPRPGTGGQPPPRRSGN